MEKKYILSSRLNNRKDMKPSLNSARTQSNQRKETATKRRTSETLAFPKIARTNTLSLKPTVNAFFQRDRANTEKKMEGLKEIETKEFFVNFKGQPIEKTRPLIQNEKKTSDFETTTERKIGKNKKLKGFGAFSTTGLIRKTNEDRFVTRSHIWFDDPSSCFGQKTQDSASNTQEKTKYASVFCVFDGHAGSNCAIFLKENICSEFSGLVGFFDHPERSMIELCQKLEERFLSEALSSNKKIPDRSGSCATICVLYESRYWVANVGDCRAIMSVKRGEKTTQITKDHKPTEAGERSRIQANGGQIASSRGLIGCTSYGLGGPMRAYPGGLTVSRSFGDAGAKVERLGGMSGVIVSDPEIFKGDINESSDFIVIGSDGLYDRLKNEEITQAVWSGIRKRSLFKTRKGVPIDEVIQELAKEAAEEVVNLAMQKNSMDNITAVVIALPGVKSFLKASFQPAQNLRNRNVSGSLKKNTYHF